MTKWYKIMSDGLKKKTPSKKVESVMIYMSKAERSALNAFAKHNDLFVTQVAREGIKMRMSGNDYNHGFNDGLNESIKIVNNTDGAKMMFPSGKSFAKLVTDEIEKFIRIDKESP